MPRRYFGHFGVNKVNVGPKAVNINIDSDQGLELAIAILKACKTQKKFDVAVYPKIVYKRPGGTIPPGKTHATVTSVG